MSGGDNLDARHGGTVPIADTADLFPGGCEMRSLVEAPAFIPLDCRHQLDVTALFDDVDLKHTAGRRLWRIEDFKPVEVGHGRDIM